MKKLTLLAMALLVLVAASCRKDNTASKPVDTNKPVSFAKDLIPMFTEDCAKGGCHVAGAVAPDLSAGSAYDQLTGLGYVNPDVPELSKVYSFMVSSTKPMPPSGKLTSDKTGIVLAWIKQGALNN